MLVKVLGIGRPNRGAELMLAAIKQQFSHHYSDAVIVTETSTDFFVRLAFWLNRKCKLPLMPYYVVDLPSLLPKFVRRFFNISSDADVDIIIDASGFAYGDQWGPQKLYQRLIYNSQFLATRGQSLFILSQALGPFTNIEFNAHLKKLINFAKIVVARDQNSFNYLCDIVGEKDNIYQYPDFTNLLSPDIKKGLPGDVAIIPNSKMIEMSAVSDLSHYVTTLAFAYRKLTKLGRKPFFLNHEGKSDRVVIDQVVALLPGPVDIVEPVDSVQLKSIIGGCDYIISARFHGLASALSQSVPCIAMGWSHKYLKLMEDYEVERYLIPVDSDELDRAINEIETNRLILVDKIKHCSVGLKSEVSEMWKKIFEIIDAR